jgi:hypothetical protein
MGQSISSTGGGHKQSGAPRQARNQPQVEPGQKMADLQSPVPKKGAPDGGADHGPRSAR